MEKGNIVKGHINEVLGLYEDISQKRLAVCKKCPLYKTTYGGQCNAKLWLDPNTGDVSLEEKDGYYKGCGCRLLAKTRVPEAHCPALKW